MQSCLSKQWHQSGLKSGSRGSGSNKFRFFQANLKKIRFFQAISIDFTRQISEKNSIYSGNKKLNFQANIAHLQLLLGKLFFFSSKIITFEHTSFIHSFIPAISIAPLQVLYYSEALPTTARILYRSLTPKRTGNCR